MNYARRTSAEGFRSSFIIPRSSFGRRLRPPQLADRDLLDAAPAAVVEIDDGARNHHRAEDRGEYAQAQHDSETFHRSGAQQEQEESRDERGDVGIQNRAPGAVVAREDRGLRRVAAAQ